MLRNRIKFAVIPVMLMLLLLFQLTSGSAAQSPVELGTTVSYAVLAGTTITNTGVTVINGDAGGDIGVSPGSSVTGTSTMTFSGTAHLADAHSLQAQKDLVTAYDDAAGRLPATLIETELGGQTLLPGVYYSTSGTFEITGTLTLDAQGDPDGVFIFHTTSTLITATNSIVNPINGARYCRIFWKVGSSATLGVTSHLVGHIFALTSITANTGATVRGQLLARNGAVTLDSNTITNGICETPSPTPTPTIAPTTAAPTTAAPTTTATTSAEMTTGATTTSTTVAITNVITEIGVTSMTTAPTTNAVSATAPIPTEGFPLTETGESLSWATIVGIFLLLTGLVIVWKRQASISKK